MFGRSDRQQLHPQKPGFFEKPGFLVVGLGVRSRLIGWDLRQHQNTPTGSDRTTAEVIGQFYKQLTTPQMTKADPREYWAVLI